MRSKYPMHCITLATTTTTQLLIVFPSHARTPGNRYLPAAIIAHVRRQVTVCRHQHSRTQVRHTHRKAVNHTITSQPSATQHHKRQVTDTHSKQSMHCITLPTTTATTTQLIIAFPSHARAPSNRHLPTAIIAHVSRQVTACRHQHSHTHTSNTHNQPHNHQITNGSDTT